MFQRVALGDTAWQWTLGDIMSEALTQRIMWGYQQLKADSRLRQMGVHDVVPTYTSIAVYFSFVRYWQGDRMVIAQRVEQLLGSMLTDSMAQPRAVGHTFEFEVDYCGEDLSRVARHAGVDRDTVIAWHSGVLYSVAMIGFLPHFPYLLGLTPKLTTPRLSRPREQVPEGAVAIGGAQTGIYPQASPGGWNIIGYTDVARLPSVCPGDRIRFLEN